MENGLGFLDNIGGIMHYFFNVLIKIVPEALLFICIWVEKRRRAKGYEAWGTELAKRITSSKHSQKVISVFIYFAVSFLVVVIISFLWQGEISIEDGSFVYERWPLLVVLTMVLGIANLLYDRNTATQTGRDGFLEKAEKREEDLQKRLTFGTRVSIEQYGGLEREYKKCALYCNRFLILLMDIFLLAILIIFTNIFKSIIVFLMLFLLILLANVVAIYYLEHQHLKKFIMKMKKSGFLLEELETDLKCASKLPLGQGFIYIGKKYAIVMQQMPSRKDEFNTIDVSRVFLLERISKVRRGDRHTDEMLAGIQIQRKLFEVELIVDGKVNFITCNDEYISDVVYNLTKRNY